VSTKAVLTTPRPQPGRLVPAVAGAVAVFLALPVFLLASLPVLGWVLGAVLWLGGQAVGLLLSRLPLGLGSLGASGVVGLGMMARAGAVMVPLIAVATVRPSLALAGALVYALAYSVELGLSLLAYFAAEPVA
jgi:hypothetical protein